MAARPKPIDSALKSACVDFLASHPATAGPKPKLTEAEERSARRKLLLEKATQSVREAATSSERASACSVLLSVMKACGELEDTSSTRPAVTVRIVEADIDEPTVGCDGAPDQGADAGAAAH